MIVTQGFYLSDEKVSVEIIGVTPAGLGDLLVTLDGLVPAELTRPNFVVHTYLPEEGIGFIVDAGFPVWDVTGATLLGLINGIEAVNG